MTGGIVIKKIVAYTVTLLIIAATVIVTLEKTSHYQTNGQINSAAPVKTSQSIKIAASSEIVWKTMANVNEWSRWESDISEPRMTGEFVPGASFDWKSGGLNIHSTVHRADRYSAIGWSGPAFGSFAVHNWTFVSHDAYTEVQVNESMEGWLVKLAAPAFQSGLDTSIKVWLEDLKKEAEKSSSSPAPTGT